MKKLKVVLVIMLSLFVVLGGLTAYFVFGTREKISYDIKKYEKLSANFDYLPSIDEIGDYKDLYFKYLHKDFFIFESDAYVLRVSYDNTEFLNQKDFVANNYSFQQTVLNHGDETVERETNFKVDTFDFKMLSLKEYNLFYPKQIVFIGASEETKEIAYIFFDDIDLDYIEGSFEEFIRTECGWE